MKTVEQEQDTRPSKLCRHGCRTRWASWLVRRRMGCPAVRVGLSRSGRWREAQAVGQLAWCEYRQLA